MKNTPRIGLPINLCFLKIKIKTHMIGYYKLINSEYSIVHELKKQTTI